VRDRVVSTKNRKEQGIIIKTTSNTNYSVSMTANSYDRIINHPGKGTPSLLYPMCPDDSWTFYQPHPSQTSQTNIPLALETDHQPEASPIAPTTADQSQELSPDHPTSIRPIE